MTTIETLPDWLQVEPVEEKTKVTKAHRGVLELTFESIFERVIDGLEAGRTVSAIIGDDPREIDIGQFMRWVRKDQSRLSRFEDAKQNGMLIIEDRLISIANGEDSAEDVQRSKLRADTYRWIMQAWNRKRYGADKEQQSSPFANGVTIVIGDVQPKGVTYDG